MKRVPRAASIAAVLAIPMATAAQEVAPIFEQAPSVLYETYRGTTSVFNEYFTMLVDKYSGSDGYGWAIYREGPKVAYRITVLPEGLESMLPIQQARTVSFQEFTEDQVDLWNTSWATRHVAVYNAAPQLSVVPEGFTVDDIRALPYHRTMVYHLKWDKAAEFRQALARRAELDRAANIENFVFTVWTGSIGTEAQTVMIRVSAESQQADVGPNREARFAARAAYREEFGELVGIMNDAAWHFERHDQTRIDELSFTPGN